MKLIGKGAFTKAYLGEDQKTVYLKTVDPIKECMSMGWFPKSRLYPKVKFSSNSNYDYEMKYYPRVTSLKQNLKPEHWEAYKELSSIKLDYSHVKQYGHSLAYIKQFKKIKNLRFRTALIEGMEACMNYGTDICFEISPRNVAVSNGNLILLDVFFSRKKLREVRS